MINTENIPFDVKEISDTVMKFQDKAYMIGAPVNCFEVYQFFYNKHKEANGSYAPAITHNNYATLMNHRYMYVLGNIEQILDAWEGKESIYSPTDQSPI